MGRRAEESRYMGMTCLWQRQMLVNNPLSEGKCTYSLLQMLGNNPPVRGQCRGNTGLQCLGSLGLQWMHRPPCEGEDGAASEPAREGTCTFAKDMDYC